MSRSPYPPRRPDAATFRRRRIGVGVAFLVVVLLIVGIIKGAFALVDAAGEKWNGTDPNATSSNTESAPPSETSQADKACKDDDILATVSVADDATELVGGEPISVEAEFEYTGSENCLRDVGARNNEIFLENKKGEKVWSSNFCAANRKINLVTMQPGDIYRVTLTWPGTKDAKKCGKVAKAPGAGEYNFYSRNGGAKSNPVTVSIS